MRNIFTMTGKVPPEPQNWFESSSGELRNVCVSILEEVVDYPQHLTLEWGQGYADITKGHSLWSCPNGNRTVGYTPKRCTLPIDEDTFFEFKIRSTYTGVYYGTVSGFTTLDFTQNEILSAHNESLPDVRRGGRQRGSLTESEAELIAKRANRHYLFFTHRSFERSKPVEIWNESLANEDGYIWCKHTLMMSVKDIYEGSQKTLRNKFFKKGWNVLKAQLPPVPTKEEVDQGFGRQFDPILQPKSSIHDAATIFTMGQTNWYVRNPLGKNYHIDLLHNMSKSRYNALSEKLNKFIYYTNKDSELKIPYTSWGIPDISALNRGVSDTNESSAIHALGVLSLLLNPHKINDVLSNFSVSAKKELKRYKRYIDEHFLWYRFYGSNSKKQPSYVFHDLTAKKVVYCPPEKVEGKVFPCYHFNSMEEFANTFVSEGEKVYTLRFHLSDNNEASKDRGVSSYGLEERPTAYMPNVGVAYRVVEGNYKKNNELPFYDYPLKSCFGNEKGYELFYLDNTEVKAEVEKNKNVSTKKPVSSIFDI